jgi:hypothetical protein
LVAVRIVLVILQEVDEQNRIAFVQRQVLCETDILRVSRLVWNFSSNDGHATV